MARRNIPPCIKALDPKYQLGSTRLRRCARGRPHENSGSNLFVTFGVNRGASKTVITSFTIPDEVEPVVLGLDPIRSSNSRSTLRTGIVSRCFPNIQGNNSTTLLLKGHVSLSRCGSFQVAPAGIADRVKGKHVDEKRRAVLVVSQGPCSNR